MPRRATSLSVLVPFLGLVSIGGAPAGSPNSLRFALAPVMHGDSLVALACETTFAGEPDGETVLSLPDRWGGEQQLWRVVRELRVEGAELLSGADSSQRVLKHVPDARVRVRYTVHQDVPGLPEPTGRNPYRPLVQPGWFHVIGNACLVAPDWPADTRVEFSSGPWPRGWSFASDLEHASEAHPLRLGALSQSISVGGDFRVLARGRGRAATRVAIRGAWSFSDSSFASRVERIIASHRRFWGEPDEPFLVTVLPLVPRAGSISLGGTGLADAFAFFATDNAEEAALNRTLAHEHMHTWIPGRLGGMPRTDESRDYWLSEGFTDFFAMRVLVRDRIWSTRDWLSATNEMLQKYSASSLRAVPGDSAAALFWRTSEGRDLPYQRGFLLAAQWDATLRERSRGRRSLDDVVLSMRRSAGATPSGAAPPLATTLLERALRDAGVDPRADIERHLTRGEPILLPATLPGSSGRVVTEELPEFHRGFDALATSGAGNVVTGLVAGSPAEAAGLRDGMRIVKRESGVVGDPRVELVYRVESGDSTRLIRYLPQGTRRVTLQRIAPSDTTAAGLERLGAWIAGR